MKQGTIFTAIILGVLSSVLATNLGYDITEIGYWIIFIIISVPGNIMYATIHNKLANKL